MYRFLLVDGIEGAGKSTVCGMIEEVLSRMKYQGQQLRVKRVHFPTEEPPTLNNEEEIEWYIDDFQEKVSSEWYADWIDMINADDETIPPPTLFLCDRSPYSTAVYQGEPQEHRINILDKGLHRMFHDWWFYDKVDIDSCYEQIPHMLNFAELAPNFSWKQHVSRLWVRSDPSEAYERLVDNGKIVRQKFRRFNQSQTMTYLADKQTIFQDLFYREPLRFKFIDFDSRAACLDNSDSYDDLQESVISGVCENLINQQLFNGEIT